MDGRQDRWMETIIGMTGKSFSAQFVNAVTFSVMSEMGNIAKLEKIISQALPIFNLGSGEG